tara:strand:- start:359 stop:1450 length:1092 start_codon:yes stop_codon:yes gene_type:complete
MSSALSQFRQSPLFKPAIIVPTIIMLIFSFFNLTAPTDPVRIASSFNLGIVNQDEGLTFPPLNLASKAMEGMAGNLPFSVTKFEDQNIARSALEDGQVAAVLIFPTDFSKLAVGDQNFAIEILNTQHLTVAETQMASQLPMLVQTSLSAAVAGLRLAMSQGQMPSLELTVTSDVETLHSAQSVATLPAPFVMTFTSWLAAMVGTILLFLASQEMAPKERAYVRTVVPLITMGLASFVLALVIATAASQWSQLILIWLNVWFISLCLAWFFIGIFEIVGLWALLIILPTVFYQSAIGGAMAPLVAAPEWLQWFGDLIPFDKIGAVYRGVMYKAEVSLPLSWLGGGVFIGLGLIWGRTLFRHNKT